MGSAYSNSEIFDLISNKQQFDVWAESQLETDYSAHLKRCIAVAINLELTENQREYFQMYFLDGITIRGIASVRGVNPSTVSRAISAAKKNLAAALRYAHPRLLNADILQRNRRIKNE